MRSANMIFGLAGLALVMAFPLSAAQASDVSTCDAPGILSTISLRFHHQSREVHHNDLVIESYTKVHQHRLEPQRKLWPIARRYCMATAHVSNGHHYAVRYFIEGGMGLASIGDNVEFCVSGFDRWNVYNSYCRVAR